MQIYYASVDLEKGFALLEEPNKENRLLCGKRVSRPSGWALFHHLKGQPIRCHFCGCEADQWVMEKGRRDALGNPVLNLYAGTRMMTRDHIIPRSLGGRDCVENLRPACAPCNHGRKNEVTPEVVRFAQEHPELVDEERIKAGLESLQRHLERLREQEAVVRAEIERLEKPYRDMGYL
jgi:hypothetical protein